MHHALITARPHDGRGVTGQWRMRLAYAYGTCADAHAARRAAALAPRTAVAACAVALPTPTTAAEQLLLHQPCTRVEESLGVSDG